MPIDVAQFEAALRAAIPLTALEIEDQSSGCGESFAVVLVSEVRKHLRSESRQAFSCFVFFFMRPDRFSSSLPKAFEGKGTLGRHRMVNQLMKAWIEQMHAFSQVSH
jgi:stress-induced morphogen